MPILPVLPILVPPYVGLVTVGRRLYQELSSEHLHHARTHRGGSELTDLPAGNEPVDVPVGDVRVVDLAQLPCSAAAN